MFISIVLRLDFPFHFVGLIIEEIADEEPTSSSASHDSAPAESSFTKPQETSGHSQNQPDVPGRPHSTSSEYLQALKDDPESIRYI